MLVKKTSVEDLLERRFGMTAKQYANIESYAESLGVRPIDLRRKIWAMGIVTESPKAYFELILSILTKTSVALPKGVFGVA